VSNPLPVNWIHTSELVNLFRSNPHALADQKLYPVFPMSLLRSLLRRLLPSLEARSSEATGTNFTRVRGSRDWISLPEHNFSGRCVRSRSGRFALAWREAPLGEDGKLRQRGRYLMLDQNRVMIDGGMVRPEDGRVADNGVFIFNDYGRLDLLSGTFVAFHPNGEVIIRTKYRANLINNGLSSDGRFAACFTANSGDENDSAILTVFDLIKGQEIARWRPESGWPSSIEFPTDGETIGIVDPHLGMFRYSLDGDFIDRTKWQRACLESQHYWYVLRVAEQSVQEAKGNLAEELASDLIHHIDRVLPRIDDKNSKARALRTRGACSEATGAIAVALENYEMALALDPKVGVKRRAAQLRKVLAKETASQSLQPLPPP
jgi:hypothetical protein